MKINRHSKEIANDINEQLKNNQEITVNQDQLDSELYKAELVKARSTRKSAIDRVRKIRKSISQKLS